jgi:hypothetical protein
MCHRLEIPVAQLNPLDLHSNKFPTETASNRPISRPNPTHQLNISVQTRTYGTINPHSAPVIKKRLLSVASDGSRLPLQSTVRLEVMAPGSPDNTIRLSLPNTLPVPPHYVHVLKTSGL